MIADGGVGKRAQEDSLVIVETVSTQVQSEAGLGRADSHSDEQHLLLLQARLRYIHVDELAVSRQYLGQLNTELVDLR